MDSGFLAPGETLDEEYDVTRPLLPAEVLGIIDKLLCLEVHCIFLVISRCLT
jgi:N-alpha-acetyltransferase 35, NatC auxiliary subunit